MEQWEAIVERPLEPGHRSFEKILQTATVVLNNAIQLAPFETEWVMETLLYAPVHLLSTVAERRGDDTWRKASADALRLLAAAVGSGVADRHCGRVVELCLLNYDAEVRKHALHCLAEVARRTDAGAGDAARLVAALGDASQCRAPLALLAGALCEHHPAVVSDEITSIWRGFLNMLENTKNTDAVIKATLEGICGLFKHFGDELPTAELGHLYDNIVNIYIKKSACQAACFNILRLHCALFRERVSRDPAMRVLLWGAAPADTILSVYAVTTQCVDRTTLKKILTTEVLPHTQSSQSKLTALRVLAASKSESFGDLTRYVDIHALEYGMRREKVSRADADLISWCVEYNLANSDRFLQAAILFYENLPSAVRRQIVANGILNSPMDTKRAAIQFLISLACEDTSAQVWRDLNDAGDEATLSVARQLSDCLWTALESVVDCELAKTLTHRCGGTSTLSALDSFVNSEELPPKLTSLLWLASKTSPLASSPLCACAPLLLGLADRGPSVLASARVVLAEAGIEDTAAFYKSIRIDGSRDEATLHEACLALVYAPDNIDIEADNMLWALQIVFSSDVEPTIHSAALKKFDYLLSNDKCLDVDISNTIRIVENLRTRGDRTDKQIRILHREVIMFLGKHGSLDVNNNNDSLDDPVIVDLKKSLSLTLPYQGTSYKVDLKTVLLLAIQHENPSVLQTLLAMLCTNLSSNKDLNSQRAVMRVVRALSGAHSSGAGAHAAAIQQAVGLCSDATDLLQYISVTKSCGVRKLLSAALSTLCEDPSILQLTAERTNVMLASDDPYTKRAGLDIAETIITSLENNNSLSKIILPELTVLIAKTHENNTKATFDIASKTFIDKKELFDKETIEKTAYNLLENVLKVDLSDVKIYKDTVEMTIEFIKNLRDVKLEDVLDTMFDISKNDVDVKLLYVLAVLKSVFSFDNDMSRAIFGRMNSLLKYLLELSFDQTEKEFFKVEVILRFIEEYCEVILELKYTETIQFLSELITKFTPALVKQLRKTIKLCFTSLNKHWRGTPKEITSSFQTWMERLPIKKITDAIEKDCFLSSHKLCVEALKIMSNVFDTREIVSDVRLYIKKWPTVLFKLYSSGRLEQYFFNEMLYFTDILTVSTKLLTSDDVRKILKTGSDLGKNMGVPFCGFFIQGFFEVLTEKPFILLDEDLKECSVILNDILRLAAKKGILKDRCENVLELVDKLWPTYEQHATFAQKHCLLANLECLPGLGPDSNPLQWVTQIVCSRNAPIDDRIKLLCFVPEETLKSPEVTSAVSAVFPARLGELNGAMLDAVAARPALLRLLACEDPSSGWWDVALESCLTLVAKRNDLDICMETFNRCRSERVCERLLVPLLRHSSTEILERFLSTVLPRILASLRKRPRGDTPHAGFEICWNEYMICLHLLLIAFERLPTWSIESPSSVLYTEVKAAPWHLVREACKLVDSLRETAHCPAGADGRLQTMYRKFQYMLYNALCAGICRRRPGPALYGQLLNANALARIADEHAQYVLPIRASWTQRNKALPVAVPLESSPLSLSHSRRSRIFLRTLSEDPMLFDLHSPQEDIIEVQDITLRETPLNAHPCAATLTALFRHVCGVPTLASLWPAVASGLRDAGRNLQWLLAQIICNCKEELKPQASVLLPGLLAVLSRSVDGACMNGLHLDVLDTILYWKEETTSEELSIITHRLITTCMEMRRNYVFDSLLKTLQGFLELYGSAIQIEWKSFEPYYEGHYHDSQKAILQLIKLISRSKIYIPQTLSKMLSKLDAEPSKVSECFGLALAACRNDEKREARGVFKKYLEKCSAITNYIRVLYYASLGSPECCGEQEFRRITDYVTNETSSDRTKCLHILSAYLSRSRHSEYVADMFELVDLSDMIAKDHAAMLVMKNGFSKMDSALRRRCVAQAAALRPAAPKGRRLVVELMMKACERLFSQPTQPLAKRQKVESTPILSVSRDDVYSNSILTCLGLGAVDSDSDVANMAREGLGAKLDKELGARFTECFLLTMYLPAHTDTAPDVCLCVSALLELLYSEVRSAVGFKNVRLRDEPLPIRESDRASKLLTLSKTFQGTFSSYSATRGRIRQTQDTNKPAIDVQVPIENILENLLEFAKSTAEAARALLTEVLRSVLSTSKFDMASSLVPLLGTLLGRQPTELTPVYIDICRLFVANSNVQSLLGPVERLRALTAGTEGAGLALLLHEEVTMRCVGHRIFQLGRPGDIQDVDMDETSEFSIEDLKYAFGKLSNWDDLTLQQRRVVTSSLPPLWTDRRDFIARLDSYEVPVDAKCWFDKMAAAYKQEIGPNSLRWLKRMDQWPRRHFEISAITEATSWQHELSEAMPSHLFKTSDCLAEWAARLMIRSSYYNSLQHSETDSDRVSKLSRSHELRWCTSASEMGIPGVLQCVDRNVEDLCESETLPWLRQKLLALRHLAKERGDTTLLRDALKKAKKYTPEYSTDPSVAIEMYHLMLLLHKDLKSLTCHELQTILVQVSQSSEQVDWSKSSKKAVSSVYELAMAHYDEAIETDAMDIDDAISNMSHVFCLAAALATPTAAILLPALLHRLDGRPGRLGARPGRQLLETLSPLISTIDPFTLELLEKNWHKFPPDLQRSFSTLLPKSPSQEKYRRCLQLVCDPEHLLAHYCGELALALRSQDAVKWKSILDRMRDKIYENPYAGPSYKLLDKHKGDLYGMYEFEQMPDFASQAEGKLKSIMAALRKEPQTTLRLADLCPTLLDHREESDVAKWFGLTHARVVKFYDKVQVFTDSIRRPVVLTMLLSSGRTRRAIQKTGERLASDAAAQRVAAVTQRLRCGGAPYSVTLLDEESGLIEYLEGHERLRTLIASTCNLDVLQSVSRPADQNLVESPAAALQAHDELCARVPPHSLRTAIEQNSSCVQDFICKKQNFTDSLADMTLLTWLLGLGDRHLQNIMCSLAGRVLSVDWGDVFSRGPEPPARLTAALLAVAPPPVLEARLQRALGALRGSPLLVEACVRVCFRWMGPELQQQVEYVRGILRGVTSSYHVTRDVISRGRLRCKDKYLELLDSVLGEFQGREQFSVEDQVSCLLRHCTAPEILSVTRSGWEPWV